MGYLKTYPKSPGLPRLGHRCAGRGAPEERVHGVGPGARCRGARKAQKRSLRVHEENMYFIILLRARSVHCIVCYWKGRGRAGEGEGGGTKRKRKKTLNHGFSLNFTKRFPENITYK